MGEKRRNFTFFFQTISHCYPENLSFYRVVKDSIKTDGNHAISTNSFIINMKYIVKNKLSALEMLHHFKTPLERKHDPLML